MASQKQAITKNANKECNDQGNSPALYSMSLPEGDTWNTEEKSEDCWRTWAIHALMC